ncbi:hypothetical protein [Ornithinimicrobium kibberense]|uniref:hypothetical protein n=1 Tax=Ornithinimicrobium kibberense TaxID=282060 RepID=UPI00361C1487
MTRTGRYPAGHAGPRWLCPLPGPARQPTPVGSRRCSALALRHSYVLLVREGSG